MDTKLEAPGRIERADGYFLWSYEHEGADYAVSSTSDALEDEFITQINWWYRTGQILKDIPRETEPLVRFDDSGKLEEVKLACPPTNS